MKTFPKPLNAQEEYEYLKKCQEGNKEAKDILILRNMRLVAHIVKKYVRYEDEAEDLISIGTIGLIKAVGTFDAKKGRLSTYAARCIENELLMYLRSQKKTAKDVSCYEPIGVDKEGNEIHLLDIMECQRPDAFDQICRKEDVKKVYGVMDQVLNLREYQVICMRYGLYGKKECTQRETAKELGISRSYISRIEKQALEKLRECF